MTDLTSNLKAQVVENDLILTKDGVSIQLNTEELKKLGDHLMLLVRTNKLSELSKLPTQSSLKELSPSEFVKTYGLRIAKDLVAQAKSMGSPKVGTGEHYVVINSLDKHLKDLESGIKAEEKTSEPVTQEKPSEELKDFKSELSQPVSVPIATQDERVNVTVHKPLWSKIKKVFGL